MSDENEREKDLDKRVEDLRQIRKLLAEGNEIPLIHPWAFLVWGVLVGGGAIVHYLLFLRASIEVKTALVWIWLPVLIMGGAVEATSWAIRISRESLPLLNRRVGSAILAAIAAVIVITVGVIRLALTTLTPGLGILVGSLPLIFYAQICYSSLFIETFAGIAVGLLFEFAGARGARSLLAAGLVLALLYTVSGVHAQLIERRKRG